MRFLLIPVLALCCAAAQTTNPAPPAEAVRIRSEIDRLERLRKTLDDQAPVLYVLAADYVHLGDLKTGLARLRDCIGLDEGLDPASEPDFAAIKERSDFKALVEQAHRSYAAINNARIAFSVPEDDLIPEGLAVDGESGTFYMGSLNRRKIVRISDKQVNDFANPGQAPWGPLCGLKVEASDHSVWANVCNDSGQGAELLHFSRGGKLLERFPAPDSAKHLFNDIVIQPHAVYLTDSLANTVYQFNRKSLQFTQVPLSRPMFYPNGIALSQDGSALYVADALGIVRVDLRTKASSELQPERHSTIAGVDGLYWYKDSLIMVQNSFGLSRIARARLTPDGTRVAQFTVLENKSDLVTSPTTGAVLGSNFYFISNTQLPNFHDGKIVDPAKLEPVHISVLQLSD